MRTIPVWDLPVRLGHLLMIGGFVLAWLTSESESWRLVHVVSGSVVVAVALFRVFWGFFGSRHARFEDFVRSPLSAAGYLGGLMRGSPQHYTGHNPAGGWAILALLGLGLAAGASGWLTYQEIGGEWFEEIHEAMAVAMLAVVLFHVAGVVVGSLAHRENLIVAMLTGRKQGDPAEAISSVHPLAATLLLAWTCAVAWMLAR